jgi:ubiquitin-like protein Pup
MATKEPGGQQRANKRSAEDEAAAAQDSADVAERKEELDTDVDDILDEIDSVLESNAEDFVKAFVQKGGE